MKEVILLFRIGDIILKNKVVLAPMAGVSNSAFRVIAKDMGCALIFAEMVSDKAIYYGNKKTMDLLYMTEYERPIAQQIFGSDLESFVYAAKRIEQTMHPDIIDINMGCPVPKVAVRAQAGSALLKDPKKVYSIVKAVVEAVSVPVTVKIRSGWDQNHINAVSIAKVIEQAGAKAITVHGRTRVQGYSGQADWNIIKQVKESVTIPVIGNGDIKSPEDAKRMLEETGCDAVMIGRAALGNPWLLRDTVCYLDGKEVPSPPTYIEKLDMLERHFTLLLQSKSEKLAVLEIRTHASWYLKGIPGMGDFKNQIFKIQSKDEFYDILKIMKDRFVRGDYGERV